MCDRREPAFDRRRFLRRMAAGGALAMTGLLLPTTADAAAPFEGIGMGEERLPALRSLATARKPAPAVSTSGVAAPRIVTRAEWGADESIRTSARAFTPIRKLIVHHTASANNPNDPAAIVRLIYQDHVIDRGFADIGYNFVIDHRGNIYEGRWARTYGAGEVHDGENADGLGVVAAHALGVNAGSCGVCLIGDFTSARPTNAAINSLIRLLAWKASRHRIDAWKTDPYTTLFGGSQTFPNICGHRDVNPTVCPGSGLERQLDGVRGSVSSLAGSFPSMTVDLAATIRYTPGASPITQSSPSGNDVRPGATTTTEPAKTTSASNAATTATRSVVGYRVLSTGGGLVTMGHANLYGSPAGRGVSDTVAITPGPSQSFWTLTKTGAVMPFGAAKQHGGLAATGDKAPAVDLAAVKAGTGYWILTGTGGVWAFGSAAWQGSLARSGARATGIRIHATPSGRGYWILGSDGGMYNYGDARWHGSAAKSGMSNAVDFWPTPSGNGYWVLSADGGVLAFGDAKGYGTMSTLDTQWAKPAVAILGMPDGSGYNILSADGGVYPFGSAPFFGSLAGSGRKAVAIAPALV